MLKVFAFSLMIFLILFMFPFSSNRSDLDRNISEAVSGYEFSYVKWQVELLRDFFRNKHDYELTQMDEAEIVWNYFNGEHENKRLAEIIIAKQIEEVLVEKGLILFPRVNFTISSMPGYLIISPREEIRREREFHVLPALGLEKREEIEGWVDALDISSYIADIAGTTTFPIVVRQGASLRNTIRLVAHEWTHQHLFFRPLGFRYALHFIGWKNDQIAAVNEAVATIVEKEVEEIIYNRYYKFFETTEQDAGSDSVLYFRGKMRSIRENVDSLLLMGEIEEAERYMEEQRLYINSYGYNIRKLNQAYFAFHGSYPSISVNPLTGRVSELREESESLKHFIDEIGSIWNADKLLN